MERLYFPVVLGTFLAFPSGYAGWPMPVLLLIILAELVTRKMKWAPTSLDRPLLALLVVSLASAVASPWRVQSVPIVALLALMFLVSVYPAARVIRARPDALPLIIALWIAGALFAAVWGILRAPAEWPGGASTLALGRVGLGTTLVAAVALALGAWTVWDRSWVRIGLAVGLPVMVTALELTTSRSAWIAAVAGAAIIIGLAPRRRAALIMLCAASVAVAILVTRVERQFLIQRLESIPSVEANADRMAIWIGALRMVRDHPLLGTGYGTFVLAWPQYHDDPALEGKPTAHNVFLNFAAETGLLGLAAFLAFLGAGFAGLWRRIQTSRGDPQADGLWVALFAAVAGMLVQQLFDASVMSWQVGYGLLASFGLAGARRSADATGYRNTPA